MSLRKHILVCICILCAISANAQNKKAAASFYWQQYAADTRLTFRQIVTICDSIFEDAGYPEKSKNENRERKRDKDSDSDRKDKDRDKGEESDDESDDEPFYNYQKWKKFWGPRIDAATGKLYDLSKIVALRPEENMEHVPAAPGALVYYNNCRGRSITQSDSVGTIIPDGQGWHWTGPRNVSSITGSNPLGQYLGRVNNIRVNPYNQNEVYIATDWGGIWKTTNANLAPNNTWKCITDRDDWVAGRGVTNLEVDFSPGGTHRIFCTIGYPDRMNYFYSIQRTVGVFYCLDNGIDWFHLLWAGESVNDIKFYPAYLPYAQKLLYIATQFKIIKLDVTGPWWGTTTPVTSTVIMNMLSRLPTDGSAGSRFRGFNNLVFKPNDPRRLFFSSYSNVGQAFAQTAELFRYDEGAPGPAGGITNMTDYLGTSDVVNNGNMTTSSVAGSGGWYMSPGWNWVAPGALFAAPWGAMEIALSGTTAKSLETNVLGSYYGNKLYVITFRLKIPANTKVVVRLTDAINLNGPDYGSSGTAASGPNIPVGPGAGGGTVGEFIGPLTNTYTYAITATHYVNRLEFAAMKLTPTATGTVAVGNVHVKEAAQHYITLATSAAAAASNDVYCMTANNVDFNMSTQSMHVRKITLANVYPWPGASVSVTDRLTDKLGCGVSISNTNPDYIYLYKNQSGWSEMVYRMHYPTGVITTDLSSTANHPDARSMVNLPNASGTADNIFMGNDGGISYKNGYSGTWKSLNGKGFTASLGVSVGTNIHTGEVAFSTADNGVLTAVPSLYSKWTHILGGDGQESKYGKRYPTRNEMFWGSSSGGNFDFLEGVNYGTPVVTGLPSMSVGLNVLSKVKTTFNNEYFGTGSGNVYNVKLTGTTSPYSGAWNCLSCSSPGFIHKSVQTVAPDMYDANYIAAYVHSSFWDNGHFAITNNGGSSWTMINNPTNTSVIEMAVDPRTTGSGKRLWAGLGWYREDGLWRVMQSTDNGVTWKDFSLGLPRGPVNALVYDEQSHYLFAGTDEGVYAINVDAGPISYLHPWDCFSLHLPASFVTGLDINRCTGKLYVSTWGRGVFETDLPHNWNWNGAGAGGFNDKCDINSITGSTGAPTIWTQDRDETRTIYVGPGKTLIVRNCTLSMGRNKNIIVASGAGSTPGGTLIVDNATITNSCGELWGCISVLGNPAVAQNTANIYAANPSSNQGLVVMKRATLEYAFYGILVGGIYYDGLDCPVYKPGKDGGLVIANDSRFSNCAYDVEFETYKFVNNSLFNNCTFIADDTIRNAHYTDYTAGASVPRKYGSKNCIKSYGTNGITITNCLFETRDNLSPSVNFHPDPDLRGCGYWGYNSSARIDNCKFKNLTRGVLGYNAISPYYSEVTNNSVTGCWRAISLTWSNYSIIYNNQITTGPKLSYLPGVLTSWDGNNKQPYGIYHNNLNFHISENTINTGGAISQPDYGIVVSATPSNVLYRNTINNCSYGISRDGAYQIKCNKIFSTKFSIYSSVGGDIGTCTNPAGNQFSPATPVLLQVARAYACPTPAPVLTSMRYTTYSNLPYKPTTYTTQSGTVIGCSAGPWGIFEHGNVIPVTNCSGTCGNFDVCCPARPSTYYIIGPGRGTISIGTALSGLANTEKAILTLEQKIDANNTSRLVSMINSPSYSSSDVQSVLMSAGPYLSDSVLRTAIARSPALAYSDLKSIIINNSSITINVKSKLLSLFPSMCSDTSVISAQNTISPRNILESDLADLNVEREQYLSALNRYYIKNQLWDNAAALFAARRRFETAFSFYILDSNWKMAQQMIDSIAAFDKVLVPVLSIHLKHAISGIPFNSLSDADSATIRTIADGPGSHVRSIARNWYIAAYNHTFHEPIFEWDVMASEQYLKNTNDIVDLPTEMSGFTESPEIKELLELDEKNVVVYPNPATDQVTIELRNSVWESDCIIIATDMYGRKVMEMKPEIGKNIQQINTVAWVSGLYLFSVQCSEGSRSEHKVIIRKDK